MLLYPIFSHMYVHNMRTLVIVDNHNFIDYKNIYIGYRIILYL